ncbi:MAG: sigma-70 family RNA polymerase sigma factor [Ruminiclostridium sp.]|nr:sigma-70 family RNA polymerase sigma factor [Ruminiclostridium sp.]
MDRTNEELCLLIQSGDQQAKTDIYNKNKRLVKKIASQYFGAYGNSLEREDLEQVGYMGLFIAAEKFNADKGVKFISYAAYWIKREIMREIAEHGYPVRIPAAVLDKVVKCINLDTSFQQQGLERKERIQAVAEKLGMTVDEVKDYLSLSKKCLQYTSLNTVVDEENQTELEELLPNENVPSVEEIVEENDLHKRLHTAISELEPQERDIIVRRYGINGNRIYTLDELSVKHGLSVERIRQIEERALRKLKFKLE